MPNYTLTADHGVIRIKGSALARQLTSASGHYFSRAPAAAHAVGDVDLWISAWVYPDTVSASMAIAAQDNFTDRSWLLYLDKDTGDGFSFYNLDCFAKAKVSMTTVAGRWYHVFGWRTAADNVMHIMVNVGTPSVSPAESPALTAGTANFSIGANAAGAAKWNGRLARLGFAKPPTALGNGTSGTLAHTIATRMFNSRRGLLWDEITSTERTDWGLVSGSGVYHNLDETSGNALESVAGLHVTAVSTPTSNEGPPWLELLAGRAILADHGSVAISGQAAGLAATRAIRVDAGLITLSGQDVGLHSGYLLDADYGVIRIRGQSPARLLVAAEEQYFTRPAHATFAPGTSDFWVSAHVYHDSLAPL